MLNCFRCETSPIKAKIFTFLVLQNFLMVLRSVLAFMISFRDRFVIVSGDYLPSRFSHFAVTVQS